MTLAPRVCRSRAFAFAFTALLPVAPALPRAARAAEPPEDAAHASSTSPHTRSPALDDALIDEEIDPEDLLSRRGASGGRWPAERGHAWISLVGFSRETLYAEREVGGLLVVGLPLDRFVRAPTRSGGPAPPSTLPPSLDARPLDATLVAHKAAAKPRKASPPPETTPSASTPGAPSTTANAPITTGAPVTAGASSGATPAGEPTRPTPSAEIATDGIEVVVTPRLARATVAAAWRTSGLGEGDARLDAIVSRARWSAILPEARLRAVRFEDERLSSDTGTESARWRDSASANVGFEGRLTWRLDRLLYADDEPAFERMKLEQRDARAKIAGKALEALFHWQRAWVELRSLPPSSRGTRDEVDAALRLIEAESVLDVMTHGWFTSEASRTRKLGGFPSIILSAPKTAPAEL